jgi:hypothetical protein
MTQHELDRVLARATGETPRRIRHIGFCLVVLPSRLARKRSKKKRLGSTSNTDVGRVG